MAKSDFTSLVHDLFSILEHNNHTDPFAVYDSPFTLLW